MNHDAYTGVTSPEPTTMSTQGFITFLPVTDSESDSSFTIYILAGLLESAMSYPFLIEDILELIVFFALLIARLVCMTFGAVLAYSGSSTYTEPPGMSALEYWVPVAAS